MEVLAKAAFTSLGECWSVASVAYFRASKERVKRGLDVDNVDDVGAREGIRERNRFPHRAESIGVEPAALLQVVL